MSTTDALRDLSKVAFDDLISLEEIQPEAFARLFFDRDSEFDRFCSIIETASRRATNILVTGEAGVGKSNFLHKILGTKEITERNLIYPIMVDYRNIVPCTPQGCMITFIKNIVVYFTAIGQPIHTLGELTEGMITHNVQQIYDHLANVPKDAIIRHLLIVIDDLDYADDDWFYLLRFFMPFAASHKCSVLLSVRPPLLAAISDMDDRFRHHYVRNVQSISLGPLEVSPVLTHRLSVILKASKAEHYITRIINRLTGATNPVRLLLDKLGVETVRDLLEIEYPFTGKHNVFMSRITNGNIREIFDIAVDSLAYVYDDRYQLERRIEDGIERRVIGREGIMKIFYDAYDRKISTYRLLNLHEKKTRKGHSLLFHVLEAIKFRRVVDPHFMAILAKCGHAEKDVRWAVEELASKINRLICVQDTHLPSSERQHHNHMEVYRLTDKGEYYLDICTWDEYVARCGKETHTMAEVCL